MIQQFEFEKTSIPDLMEITHSMQTMFEVVLPKTIPKKFLKQMVLNMTCRKCFILLPIKALFVQYIFNGLNSNRSL